MIFLIILDLVNVGVLVITFSNIDQILFENPWLVREIELIGKM